MTTGSKNIILRCLRSIFRVTPVWMIFCAILFAAPLKATAIEPEPVFYETSVFVVVQGIGGAEIPAVINNDSAYLSITDIFNFLKIRNTASPHMDSIYGFFINENAPFLVDKKNNVIHYQDKIVPFE
ncbi:hypothetical protein QFZ51_002346 [Chitinophaga sp. W3I9]|uniref:hypothetical protein n=1 Tax=Chitinophaga sp. W3I9 TaxID=3373924 RepID=UPI003D1FC0D7